MTPIDFTGSMMRAQSNALALGQQQQDMANANKLRQIYQEHGQGIAQGNPAALAHLAPVAPMQAYQIGRQNRADTRSDRRLEIQVAEYARQVGIDAFKRERAELSDALAGASHFYQTGDAQGYAAFLQSKGVDPASFPFEQFPAHAAQFKGVLDAMDAFAPEQPDYERVGTQVIDMNNPLAGAQNIPNVDTRTAAVETLHQRALAAGYEPGSPEYQEMMRTGGRGEQFTEFVGADGSRFTSGTRPLGGVDGSTGAPLADAPPPPGGEQAFGVRGIGANLANTVTDAIGAGEVFPTAAAQSRFFRNLEEDMLVELSQAYGRQPAQALMERLRVNIPNPGTLEGPDRAYGELVELERRFQGELQTALGQMQTRNRKARGEASTKVAALERTLQRIGEGKERIRPSQTSQGTGTTGTGIKWSVKP